MRRWNGWGDESVGMALPASARAMLEESLGPGTPLQSCAFSEVISRVPRSRLSAGAPADTDAEVRVRHSRGHSLPDWIELRSGRISTFPDGVAFPETERDLSDLFHFADRSGAVLIPCGGGTGVVGQINPPDLERPVITVSLSRMRDLLELDETSGLATFGAGVTGPELEAALARRGLTLGHFPQSFEYSTLGGWVATRSSGQQSLGYGRMEDLFRGGLLHTPEGPLDLPPHPASAAGPDLRHLVLGSEGRMGILSRATVQVRSLSRVERFHGLFLPHWDSALDAVRTLVREAVPLSMIRLSNAAETRSQLALSGKEGLVRYLRKYLRWKGIDPDSACMLLLGFTGSASGVRRAKRETISFLKRRHRAAHLHRMLGSSWARHRFRAPYLRNTLWEEGYAVDTLETAVPWDRVGRTVHAVEEALRSGLRDEGEGVLPFSHLSHFYPTGCSIYTTYVFRLADDPELTRLRWQKLKEAASAAILAQQGTISHHHGVGTDHRRYMEQEKGELGVRAIRDICRSFDPRGILNPGKLV